MSDENSEQIKQKVRGMWTTALNTAESANVRLDAALEILQMMVTANQEVFNAVMLNNVKINSLMHLLFAEGVCTPDAFIKACRTQETLDPADVEQWVRGHGVCDVPKN